jgi:hypothetical protein
MFSKKGGKMKISTTKILMELIKKYLETLEKAGRGEMAEFGREYNIPAATMTRIKGEEKEDEKPYIPKTEVIFDCLRGIAHRGFIGLNEYDSLYEGARMAQELILPLIQLADILAHKDLVSPAMFKTLVDLLAALHTELIIKWQANLKIVG